MLKSRVGFALFLSAFGVAHAGAIVTVSADTASRVYLDGEAMGVAPLKISNLKSGTRVVKIENLASGEIKVFNVLSPKSGVIEKTIDVSWAGDAPVVEQLAPHAATVTVAQPVVVQSVPVVVARPVGGRRGFDRRNEIARQNEREKVRARNTLLGAAVANEVLNRGNSKGLVRGVTLGGALLNEVLR